MLFSCLFKSFCVPGGEQLYVFINVERLFGLSRLLKHWLLSSTCAFHRVMKDLLDLTWCGVLIELFELCC